MTWWALRPWPQPPKAHDSALMGWDALAHWALGWTPDVYRLPEAVVLHATPAARLWGGARAWWAQMQSQLHGLGGWAQMGVGDTPWQAQARLLLAAVAQTRGAHEGASWHAQPAADALPLWTLPCWDAHGAAWQALGLRRWGDLCALPRGSVAKRWGQSTVHALDQAYGRRPHGLLRLVAPAHFDQTVHWADPVDSWAQCTQPAHHLLQAMARWLQTRQLQAQACRWHALHERPRAATPVADAVDVRMSHPSASAQAWWRLTQSHWQARQTAAPLVGLRLEVIQTQAALAPSHDLWHGTGAAVQQSLGLLLDRMQAQWGNAAVQQLQPAAAALPEAAQRVTAWGAHNPAPAAPAPMATGPIPSWLLRPPLRLWVHGHKPWYQGPLHLLLGPQRVEQVAWALLDGGANLAPSDAWVQRDYFVARSEHAGLLWVFRQAAPNEARQSRWYLHGWFA